MRVQITHTLWVSEEIHGNLIEAKKPEIITSHVFQQNGRTQQWKYINPVKLRGQQSLHLMQA